MATKQSDGRYRAKVTVGHDADGKAIVKYVSGRTKKELEAAKEEARRAYVTGITEVQRNILFGTYAKEWFETYKRPKVGLGSQMNYASIFNVHLIPCLGDRQMKAITPMDLQSFLNSKAYLSASTVSKIYSTLKQIFARATAQYILDRDPALCLEKPAAKSGKRRALTEREALASLRLMDEHPEGLIVCILYYTGLRLGEALGLQWGDIDFSLKTIRVQRDIDFKTGTVGSLKTRASYRTIPLAEPLCCALYKIRGVGNAYVLQAPKSKSHLSQSTAKRQWDRLMRALYQYDSEVECRPGETASILTPHYYRHNYATVLYNAGVDVLTAQKWLGHSDSSTTLEIYSHLAKETEDLNAKKINAAFGNFSATFLSKTTSSKRST